MSINEKKNIILMYGNKEFNNSLAELKNYLKFELKVIEKITSEKHINNYKGFLIHEDELDNIVTKNLLKDVKTNKIIFYRNKKIKGLENIEKLSLPTTIEQINNIVINNMIKSEYKFNSSLKINNYILDKNSRKLIQNNKSIELTEKEIELIELLNNKNFTKKKEILLSIWKYSDNADTHTVETHIYRLRKKIKDVFGDNKFIKSEKKGYTI